MPSTTVPPQPRVRPLDLAAWAAALFLASTLFGHTVAVRQSLLALAVVFALAETVMRYRRGEPRLSLRPPLLLLFLAFGAWAIASLGWTERPDLTLKELRNELLYPLIAFWACYVAAQGRRAIAVVLMVLGVRRGRDERLRHVLGVLRCQRACAFACMAAQEPFPVRWSH